MLTTPTNGMITCSLGGDGAATVGDTCSYTCNTGYVLSGSDMRTCGSDGMWDDAYPTCIGKKNHHVCVLLIIKAHSCDPCISLCTLFSITCDLV